jgi:ABC-2 type transport system permease protein
MSATALPSQGLQQESRSAPSVTQALIWSIRRELWEFRSIYVGPVIVAALIVLSHIGRGLLRAPQMRDLAALSAMQQQELIERPYSLAALFLMGITFIVAIFYCLEAMQSERRDRSILFWKSLPLSDLTVVLSKMSIPILILPLIAVVLTIVSHVVMAVFSTIILKITGQSTEMFWSHFSLGQIWGMMLYHMLILHGLWFAPVYGWLLLVSAWARRLAFLWAALPLVILGVGEKVAFNTSHFLHWLEYRFGGGAPGAEAYPGGPMAMHSWAHLHFDQLLLSPGLWTGLAFAAVCVVAAVRVRRSRGPM